MHSDGTTGVTLIGKAAIHTDGFPKAEEDGLVIQNASRLSVYILMATDFADKYASGFGKMVYPTGWKRSRPCRWRMNRTLWE